MVIFIYLLVHIYKYIVILKKQIVVNMLEYGIIYFLIIVALHNMWKIIVYLRGKFGMGKKDEDVDMWVNLSFYVMFGLYICYMLSVLFI